MLLDYDLHEEKRAIQDMIFPLVKQRKVITLAGPNLLSYIEKLPIAVRHIEIWEKEPKIMMLQLPQLKEVGRKVTYVFGDIIKASVESDAFYDLDFCCSISTARRHIEKFENCAYSLTLSIRPVGTQRTLSSFLDIIEERKISDIPHPQYNLLITDKNRYIYRTYCDRTPMLYILKL